MRQLPLIYIYIRIKAHTRTRTYAFKHFRCFFSSLEARSPIKLFILCARQPVSQSACLTRLPIKPLLREHMLKSTAVSILVRPPTPPLSITLFCAQQMHVSFGATESEQSIWWDLGAKRNGSQQCLVYLQGRKCVSNAKLKIKTMNEAKKGGTD